MKKFLPILCAATTFLVSTPAFSQVSNDNEDGVNKVDERQKQTFVPGQAIVKFKDESSIQVQQNSKGRFRAASINAVDEILREFGADEVEKLFPTATPKPQSKLRRKAAPNGQIVQESNLDKVFWVKTGVMSADSTMQMVKRLQELPDVEYAEPNYYAYITADMPTEMPQVNRPEEQKMRKAPVSVETTASVICPNPSNNPLYSYQYGITQQNIHQLWDKPIINKKRPVIAILDTGVDINHPDLADNIWTNPKEADGETAYDDDDNGIVDDVHGWNFVEDYYDLTDRNGHGTHCAGIAAAADNGIGIVGANPLALIMPVKVMSDKGEGDIATIARGIVYAAENGADILSMSFGGSALPQTEKDALNFAYQTAILVASAGNKGYTIYSPCGTNYPAAYYLVLGVEASDQNRELAGFSNFDPDGPIYSEDGIDGRNYEIQVPGVDIYSTYPNGQYKSLNGTSMSTPLFAGAISALQMVKDYPSKDVLFGDLIHLKADFAKIYSDDTPRMPQIDLVAMNVDDDIEGNSNIDGQIDVGETIKFTPVLRNTWADASDIQMHLSVDPIYAGFVEIQTPDVAFGHSLSAYGRLEAATPFRARFSDDIDDATRIKFSLEISYYGSTESFTHDIYVTVNNMVKLNGLITEDRTLTANHIYYVNDNLAIPEGVTLTIEPGTHLEFAEGKGLSAKGKLIANGTPEKQIVFSGHNGGRWAGIWSHESTGGKEYRQHFLFTNADSTLFTLRPTEQTPNKMDGYVLTYYSGIFDVIQSNFNLYTYLNLTHSRTDLTAYQNLLTDPDFLTPAMLQMLSDVETYLSQFPTSPTEQKSEYTALSVSIGYTWYIDDNPQDTISYCKIENCELADRSIVYPYMKDCMFIDAYGSGNSGIFEQLQGIRTTVTDVFIANRMFYSPNELFELLPYSNIVNNHFGYFSETWDDIIKYSVLTYNNYFNNSCTYTNSDEYEERTYALGINTLNPSIDNSKTPSYLGSSREDIIRPMLFEMGNSPSYGKVDLTNMPTRPYSEAHGIVWKVCVNGKDAQDEYEDLAPLGVGKHKFEVYFNRPMNKAVEPQITFGVREPYNQHDVAEDGSWNADGTIYTAYVTITGKTMSDGKNRIYVQGAEDNEYFLCPYEKDRFNFLIGAAGSLATGFSAEPGMGRVNLTWNNDENDFEDAMGFNIYRFGEPYEKQVYNPHYDDEGNWQEYETIMVADTLRLNTNIVDIETTEYIDYDVTPGTTYYYMYKVLSTDLQEYDVSNVVAATPLTSTLGDANGSGEVDVADVITTVNYAAGMNPKPFIFEAADMNTDKSIDILDVVGIIQSILNQSAGAKARVEAVATYTVEDGIVYVESPVELAGVQVQLNAPGQISPTTLDALNGFEHASAWLTDEDYLFLGYNMSGKTIPAGKHALFSIGDAQLRSLRLSDAMGGNVVAEAGNATAIEMQTAKVLPATHGIYNLNGQKVAGSAADLKRLPKGVYVVDGTKMVK